MQDQDLIVKEPTKALAYVDPAAVAAAETAKARIQSAYIMAYQKPRSEDQARVRILEACKRPAFAAKVEYAKKQGRKQNEKGQWVDNYITGPSVRFAELAIREWGNILAESQVIYEDANIRRTRVTVIDLETNATFSKELAIRKTVERKKAEDREIIGQRLNTYNELVFIVLATEDELANKEAAMISKALRNEGLRIIPSDIIDEGLEIAKVTLRNQDSQDPKAAKKRVVDAFVSIGIKPNDLMVYLGHSLDTVSPQELENLRGVHAAIKEGDASWADYVTTKKLEEIQGGDGKTATEKLAEKTRKKPGPKPKMGEGDATPNEAIESGLASQGAPQETEDPGHGKSTQPQNNSRPIAPEHLEKINAMLKAKDLDPAMICQEFEVESLDAMDYQQGISAMEWVARIK